ncbi:MAG: hypothetical protein ABL967_19275 [Bryobacteraceae bacterium]
MRRSTILLFACLSVIFLATRLAHSGILWADEDYHLAAAIQALHGKVPYRDLWYDKPPLNLVPYLLFGAQTGWILRIACAAYALGLCALSYRFAADLWTRREGIWASLLMAFFLVFYFPGATLTLEPDTLMIAPHLAALYFAGSKRPFLAGVFAGIATLFNVKGLFVAASCAVFGLASLPWLVAGLLVPVLAVLGGLTTGGALSGYWQQVWQWGFLYAKSPDTLGNGLIRALNWSGFHAALLIGACVFLFCRPAHHSEDNQKGDGRSQTRWPFAAWLALSLAGAAVGWRFLPRYFDGVLPPLVILAARGMAMIARDRRLWLGAAAGISLLIPAARFGPRYAMLASDALSGAPSTWQDTLMDRDSQSAAAIIQSKAGAADTIFIWGYRPNIVAYTRMPVASRLWDSQPVTGVPADRHLSNSTPVAAALAAANRAELMRSSPTFIADGLSFFNPKLDIRQFDDLKNWFANYCEVGKTQMTILYRRCDAKSGN